MKKTVWLCLLSLAFSGPVAAVNIEFKYNTAQWLPFIVLDSTTEEPEPSVVAANIALKILKAWNKPQAVITLTDGDGTGAGQDCATDGSETPEHGDLCNIGQGKYRIYLNGASFDTKGNFSYEITGAGFKNFEGLGIVQTLTADEESDLFPANQPGVNASGHVILQDGSLSSAKLNQTAGFAYCDITASTSGEAFQIGACTDWQANALTLSSNMFELWGLVAYTNGGASCNVAAQGVMVQDSVLNASNLDITVATDSAGRGAFSATPSATNCGIIIVK